MRKRRDDALSRVGWDRLEHLLAVHYEQQGFEVEHVGTGGSGQRFDGGIDLKLRKDDAYILVQSKHWNAYKVTHNAVHELLGLMVNECATGAILVTSGEFTQAAISAAQRQGHVLLIDGDELRTMLGPDALGAADETPDRADEFVRRLSAPRSVSEPARVRSYDFAPARTSRAWFAVSVVGLALFVLLISALLKRTEGTARPPVAATTAANVNLPVPDTSSVANAPPRMTPSEGGGCREVVDHFSGTFIDHCAPGSTPRQPTPAEVREQQRLADEAIKVLEASTPEM